MKDFMYDCVMRNPMNGNTRGSVCCSPTTSYNRQPELSMVNTQFEFSEWNGGIEKKTKNTLK